MSTTFKSPTIFVIFGATGDLSRKKLLPALYSLFQEGVLPKRFAVVGFSRREWDNARFQKEVKDILGIKRGGGKTADFLKMFSFQRGYFEKEESYRDLSRHIAGIDQRWKVCSNKLFHLAVSPNFYSSILENLGKHHLTDNCGPAEGWTRILVEKPFGRDSETAKELDALLGRLFKEQQIFRVDHYLAKETLQNILTFRFSNAIFESSWNYRHIEKVELKLLETEDVGERGDFYDQIGALRDVGQNHLLQMLAAVAMDHPGEPTESCIRRERARILGKLRIMKPSELSRYIIRGQYRGYRSTPGVKRGSERETYFKMKVFIRSPRWRGVPFYLESGKALNKWKAEIVIYFREPQKCFCPTYHQRHLHQNTLTFRIQPHEGIALKFWAKRAGLSHDIEARNLSFHYGRIRDSRLSPYEKIIYDSIVGDQTLFSSTEEVMAAWKFITPILRGLSRIPLHFYQRGSRGPSAAEKL